MNGIATNSNKHPSIHPWIWMLFFPGNHVKPNTFPSRLINSAILKRVTPYEINGVKVLEESDTGGCSWSVEMYSKWKYIFSPENSEIKKLKIGKSFNLCFENEQMFPVIGFGSQLFPLSFS